MKQIQLGSLKIANFKGIKDFSVEFDDVQTDIYGDNATGKTTLFDAITWLLFNKDSLNSAQFDILPIGNSGAEAEVEAVIMIDREVTVFKKRYSEKWTKRRGSAQSEMTGHTIDHFVNGVPVKKSEYDAAIAEICDETTFRLLTDPRYFNREMHWTKRRELLFEACGNITDEEIIASKPELAGLSAILGSLTMDQYKDKIKARRTEVNKEIADIPVRISEAERSKGEAPEDPAKLKKEVETLTARKKTFESELLRLEEGGQKAELTRKYNEISAEILRLQNEDTREYQKIKAEVDKRNEDLRADISRLRYKKQTWGQEQEYLAQQIKANKDEAEQLRSSWREMNEAKFNAADKNCPTCGQLIPVEQLAEAEKSFNIGKSKGLEEITRSGKAIKQLIDELTAKLQSTFPQQSELDKLESQPPEEYPAKKVNPEIAKLGKQQKSLQDELEALNTTEAETKKVSLTGTIQGISDEITAIQNSLAVIETNKRQDERIKELKKQEKVLAAEFEKIEGELALLELFTRTQAGMISENINSKFEVVSFQLFKEQINGGIQPVCNTTVNGVPYESLNSGMRINAGLDIINVLSKHYDLEVFQFIDNAESITELQKTSAQRIRLVVSAKDKKLRIGK